MCMHEDNRRARVGSLRRRVVRSNHDLIARCGIVAIMELILARVHLRTHRIVTKSFDITIWTFNTSSSMVR